MKQPTPTPLEQEHQRLAVAWYEGYVAAQLDIAKMLGLEQDGLEEPADLAHNPYVMRAGA